MFTSHRFSQIKHLSNLKIKVDLLVTMFADLLYSHLDLFIFIHKFSETESWSKLKAKCPLWRVGVDLSRCSSSVSCNVLKFCDVDLIQYKAYTILIRTVSQYSEYYSSNEGLAWKALHAATYIIIYLHSIYMYIGLSSFIEWFY